MTRSDGTPLIEFQTLGALELRGADGRELHALLAQPKRIALLVYLCIAQPRGFHHRDTLVGLFWPNADQEHARASLRKALHILRRALGDDAIPSRGDEEVGVDFQRILCDAVAFEERLRADRLDEALDFYRGDLLPGFFVDDAPEFEQWLESARARLRTAAARAAYAMADRLGSTGDPELAVSWAQRAFDLADTDERTLGKLLELQYRTGDRAKALQTYGAFARRLAVEYHAEPSAQIRSLVERLRAGGDTFALIPATTEADRAARKVSNVSVPESVQVVNPRAATGRTRKILYVLAALAILLTAASVWMRPAPPKQVVRYVLQIDSAESIAQMPPWAGRLAISPDGASLAYIGGPKAQLIVRPRNQLRGIAVPGSEGALTPFFSPDGKQVGFLGQRSVMIAPIAGGRPISVADSLTGVAGASWGPDGFIYVDGQNYVPLARVEAKPGGKATWFTALDTAAGEYDHMWPDVLPNGKGVLFTVAIAAPGLAGRPSHAIAVAEIPSGQHHVLVNDAMYARYAASGHLLYVTTNKTLMMAPFDENAMKLTGAPTALQEGMRVGTFGSADLAVSAAGTLVYGTGAWEGLDELAWVTRDGKAQAVDPDWGGNSRSPVISPDGTLLAVTRRTDDVSFNIYIKKLDRGQGVRLSLEGSAYSPEWTPDGRSVTYCSADDGVANVWTKRADGSAQAVLQWRERRGADAVRWSPDGKWLVFETDTDKPDSGDILGVRPRIDTVATPLVATRFAERSPVIAPNGRWLAYSSNESGRSEIYVVPFPNASAAKWVVSTTGGTNPEWAHSGRELFYRDGAKNLVAVEVGISPVFSIGRSVVLFSTVKLAPYLPQQRFAVSPDDQRFIMNRPKMTDEPDQVIIVENWFDELRAKPK